MQADLSDLTRALLRAATRAGAEAADALAVEGRSVSVDVRGGILEQAERAEGVEVGLRVLIGRRQACISASDTSDATIARLAERAVAMAREAPEDPHVGLADGDALASDVDAAALDLVDRADAPAPATLQDMAMRAEAASLAVAGISQVASAGASHGSQRIHLSATNGFSGGYARTGTQLSCVAITGEGTAMERDYHADSRVHAGDLDAPETVGRIAAERTLARAGARRPPTGAFPVLYDERISASLIGSLLMAINGSSVARGSSFLRDALGEPVLPDDVTLEEDPRLPRISASRPFDAEGLATARRGLVVDGILQGWTTDLATARKLGVASTANAARGPSAPPSPSTTNIRMTQGAMDPAAMMREMGRGLWVTSMIGSTVNPTTGDYSRGAAGIWVENGEPAYPVNECTVAGNLRDMLRRLTPSNDARLHLSRAVPSLLVEGLTIAGG